MLAGHRVHQLGRTLQRDCERCGDLLADGCTTTVGCGGGSICIFYAASSVVSIPSLPSGMLGVGLTVLGDAVTANHEEIPEEMPGDDGGVNDGLGDGFGNGLGGAF